MIIILDKNEELKRENYLKAKEDYGTYIKVTVDVEKETMALGGEYHSDAEKMLLDRGSKQEDIWGGGVDMESKQILVNAMINLRPKTNYSTDILNQKIRSRFLAITKRVFRNYV